MGAINFVMVNVSGEPETLRQAMDLFARVVAGNGHEPALPSTHAHTDTDTVKLPAPKAKRAKANGKGDEFPCPTCDRVFDAVQGRSRHKGSCPNRTEPESKDDGGAFKCGRTNCGRGFASQGALNIHIARSHYQGSNLP